LLHLVKLAIDKTGLRHLCIAGGVGLNSVANYQLLQQLELEDIFIFPAAGDNGIAAGCALWAYHEIEHGQKRFPLKQATLGKTYSDLEVTQALQAFDQSIEVEQLTTEEIIVRSAASLAKGHIIARFEGGAEYGPRALGHRSILADPTFLRMKDIVNARVKFREAFRPFAPVIPLEAVSQVFEQPVAAPFMLLISQIKSEFRSQIPAVTHVDGSGRVQTVTASENPFFYHLCHQLVVERQGVPVLLNTSFNVAGQPIVETPTEAISTFLSTDIDFLAIDNFWVTKRHTPVLDYGAHLQQVGKSAIPTGLSTPIPAVTHYMTLLDRALFFGEFTHCPWSEEELKKLSAQGGRFKETSHLFPETPFYGLPRTQLSDDVILLVDPLGQSLIVDLTQKAVAESYSFDQVKLLLAVLRAPRSSLEQTRTETQLTTRELEEKIQWAQQELSRYRLVSNYSCLDPLPDDSVMPSHVSQTLATFKDPNFSAYQSLAVLRDRLKQLDYTESKICQLLGVISLQHIEPTHLHYYNRYVLPHSQLGDIIRLFLLRVAIPEICLQQIFGTVLFSTLCQLGILIPRDNAWAARIDLFDVDGLYIATDHRYMILSEDAIDENPIMYVGMDSIGLVHTAPRYSVDRVLDLCCGSGVQGLIASRYAKTVVSIDINPRAIRYARFNAQLNGVRNIEFRLGNLYESIEGRFDTILANPPFVPSPTQEFRFRDGGETGEDILSAIVKGSDQYLTEKGHLFIVTDLVNISTYQDKLKHWWRGGAADQLVLGTADRNDILFSVPHCHAAFSQSYEEYRTELDRWLYNFHRAGLSAVNFGYILICCTDPDQLSSYYTRTIHNPSKPIHTQVQTYFQQRALLRKRNATQRLVLAEGLQFRIEVNAQTGDTQIAIFSLDNPYFTTYPISDIVYESLRDIQRLRPRYSTYVNPENQNCIHDLVYKGIIVLTSDSTATSNHSTLRNSGVFEQHSRVRLQQAGDQDCANKAEETWTIRELQTKTTPTCLSSYLS
jgi:carbamoyltransferase